MEGNYRLSLNRINHYLDMAHHACYYSDNHKTRLGCVVVYKNKVISVGWNMNKTNPLQKELNTYRGFDSTSAYNSLHAEVHALLKCKNLDIDWRRVNLFVYRIKKDGTRGMAKPCEACQALIRNMGIREVYYSTARGFGYEYFE